MTAPLIIPQVAPSDRQYSYVRDHTLSNVEVTLGDLEHLQKETSRVVEKLCGHHAWLERQRTATLFAMQYVFDKLFAEGLTLEWNKFFRLNEDLFVNKIDTEETDDEETDDKEKQLWYEKY